MGKSDKRSDKKEKKDVKEDVKTVHVAGPKSTEAIAVSSKHDASDSEASVSLKKHRKSRRKSVSESSETSLESSSSSNSAGESEVSFSTTDFLSNDPLYFVLSKFLLTKDNKNITEVLEEINKKLASR